MSCYKYNWEQAVVWLKNQPDKMKLVMDCYYDDPIETAACRFARSEEWKEVNSILNKQFPCDVLDLGAGRGISSYAFAKCGCNVTAVEPDKSPVVGTAAIERLINNSDLDIKIICEKCEDLHIASNSFDIVYGRAVLHHSEDLYKFCQEAARVLKKGGAFLITREHVISKKEDLIKFQSEHPLHFLYGGENAYLLDEYLDAISFSGLRVINVLGHWDSVINYAPMSSVEFTQKIANALNIYLPGKIAIYVSKIKIIQKYYGLYLTKTMDMPGRLYSFLAIKI